MSRFQSPAYKAPLLPPWLRRFFSSVHSHRTSHLARRYEVAFEAAQARSLVWGLHRPNFQASQIRLGTKEVTAAVQRELLHDIGGIGTEIVARQRFGLTAAVRTLLERTLRAPLLYTLGYVQHGGQKLCHTSIPELEQLLYPGRANSRSTNLHAWLTLPSHEIIDISFWALFPHLCGQAERDCRVLFMHPSRIETRSYHPQLVGDGFVRKIGLLKEYEGW